MAHLSFFPEAKNTIQRLKGVTVIMEQDKCIGCGKCTEVCLTGAAVRRNGKSQCDDTLCKTCGVCAQACPQKAIRISVENIEATVNELLGRIHQDVGGLPVKSYQGFQELG